MFQKIIFITLLSMSTVAYAETKVIETLCSPDEEVVFSCSCSKKAISLCATKDINANSGQLTYRYGTSKKTELEYPTKKIAPAKAFTAHFYGWAKGSYSSISFKLEEYTYTVYNRNAAFEEDSRSNGGGVKIFQNGKLLKDIWCNNPSIQDNIQEKLYHVGLPETK